MTKRWKMTGLVRHQHVAHAQHTNYINTKNPGTLLRALIDASFYIAEYGVLLLRIGVTVTIGP